MSPTARPTFWSTLWCPGSALLVVAIALVAAPTVMAPLFDNAVNLGGLPAGLVVLVVAVSAISLGGLGWIRVTHRSGLGLGGAIAMVVVTVAVLLLLPLAILVIKNVGSEGRRRVEVRRPRPQCVSANVTAGSAGAVSHVAR